jgi:hypothetical protein
VPECSFYPCLVGLAVQQICWFQLCARCVNSTVIWLSLLFRCFGMSLSLERFVDYKCVFSCGLFIRTLSRSLYNSLYFESLCSRQAQKHWPMCMHSASSLPSREHTVYFREGVTGTRVAIVQAVTARNNKKKDHAPYFPSASIRAPKRLAHCTWPTPPAHARTHFNPQNWLLCCVCVFARTVEQNKNTGSDLGFPCASHFGLGHRLPVKLEWPYNPRGFP